MTTKTIVALALTLASSAALAQQSLSTVEVRAESEKSLTIACTSPSKPSLKEVEDVFGIADRGETPGVRMKLMKVAEEACVAGESRIQVTRGANALTWNALR